MNRPVHLLVEALRKNGYKIEKLGRGETYRLDSKIIWFDYSRERPGAPGIFFHGTSKKAFDKLYNKHSDSFFIVFLLGFPKTTEAIVVSAHRFDEMFKQKNTDKTGHWKYSIHLINGRYVVKVWGVRDFDVTDGLHNYEFIGLTQAQSVSLRNAISSTSVRPKGTESSASIAVIPALDSHEAVQGTLLLLGKVLGFDTYTPNRSKQWNGKSLGELASVSSLPEFTYSHLLKFVREIDVIWFLQGYPSHCFEVEHTTNVRDGLLRQYQIAQATNAKFFIVGPENQRAKFETEVEGEPFRKIKERYTFRSYGDLVQFYKRASEYNEERQRFGT